MRELYNEMNCIMFIYYCVMVGGGGGGIYFGFGY